MSDRIISIAKSLANALPPEAEVRDELTALGFVATGILYQVDPSERAELVETFCRILRKGCTSDFN